MPATPVASQTTRSLTAAPRAPGYLQISSRKPPTWRRSREAREMSEKGTVKLQWQGPVMWGNLPESKAEFDYLNTIAAVYVFFRCYGDGTMLAYVGKANKLADR